MNININQNPKKRVFVLDNFYEDPYAVRELALQQNFIAEPAYFKGKRTDQQIIFPGTKEAFENLIGQKIVNWAEMHGMCGRFQSCCAEDQLVYHVDGQQFAGMIYLTPNAPFSGGTATYAHKKTRSRSFEDEGSGEAFSGGFYDGTPFEPVDVIGNVFNRLVIFDARCFHAAHQYFGTSLENARLFHMFFFD
jgi:hypothetical protein